MEAKDTVMVQDQIDYYSLCRDGVGRYAYDKGFLAEILKAQAKISFKAGQAETERRHFKAGIREVVEWLIKHSWDGSLQHWSDGGDVQCVAMEDWQAKLKEWGIEG